MQILIALCSNILKTMTVVIFGGLITYGGSSSLWCLCTNLWKDESLFTGRRSCRVHHPSDQWDRPINANTGVLMNRIWINVAILS